MHFLYDAAVTVFAAIELGALIVGHRKHEDFIDFAHAALEALVAKDEAKIKAEL